MASNQSVQPTCGNKCTSTLAGGPQNLAMSSPAPTCGLHMTVADFVAHHDVVAGDNLSNLAHIQLGDVNLATDLAQLNQLCPPYHLNVGQRLIMPDYTRYDVTVAFIHNDMITNCGSAEAREIQDAHQRAQNFNAEARRYYADAADDRWYEFLATSGKIQAGANLNDAAALARLEAKTRWFLQVRANGPWDHKPILRQMYVAMSNPPGSYGQLSRAFHFPIRGDVFNEYYYDIWSNIHYGFVGRCAGFDATTLQEAGDLGLPGFGDNDQGDFISTQIGIDLWDQFGLAVTQENIRQAIVNAGPSFSAARQAEIANGTPAAEATNVVIQNNDYK